MERVMFLIEPGGERLACLLNPEGLEIRRRSGVQTRRLANGALSGSGLPDDPLLCTGGGSTELRLDLLFDVEIAGSSLASGDVRDLTRPFWRLAENVTGDGDRPTLSVARFIWGKSWNIPGVVAAVAERLERFTPGGVPQRSWLRMRFLRVAEPEAADAPEEPDDPDDLTGCMDDADDDPAELPAHLVTGDGDEGGDRLDLIAERQYGSPGFWRVIAGFNGIDDPSCLPPGTTLRLPPRARVQQQLVDA